MTKPTIRPNDATMQKKYEAMIASTVLLEVRFHRFGDKRQTDLDGVKMETRETEAGTVAEVPVTDAAFQLSRRLLGRTVGRELRGLIHRTMKRLREISVPSFDREGVYRLSYAAVETAEKLLLKAREEMEGLKYEFREAYDAEVQSMREQQREKFNPKDYPSAYDAAERWGIEWAYMETASVPKALGGVNHFIYERAMETARKRAAKAVEAVEQTLRAGLLACVEKMKADLQATTPLGNPRAYREDALQKVTAFFATFPMRNFINDGVSAEALKEMTKLLKNIPEADALDDAALRAQVVAGLASVADTVRPFVDEVATRQVILPD